MEKVMQAVLTAWEECGKPSLIVVDGKCGSGKTTLARALAEKLQAPVIHMDDFFLPFDMRTAERLSAPGGNVHYERFAAQVLPNVGKEPAFSYQKFHCGDGSFSDEVCPSAPVRIVEGSYSLHPMFRETWEREHALTVFLNVEEGEQLRRLEKRNPALLEAFSSRWIPMENQYFDTCRVPQAAKLCLETR